MSEEYWTASSNTASEDYWSGFRSKPDFRVKLDRNHRFSQDLEGFLMIFDVFCSPDGIIHRLANWHFVTQKYHKNLIFRFFDRSKPGQCPGDATIGYYLFMLLRGKDINETIYRNLITAH